VGSTEIGTYVSKNSLYLFSCSCFFIKWIEALSTTYSKPVETILVQRNKKGFCS
jgi:hypothetical protein